jgi:hypothetical protein
MYTHPVLDLDCSRPVCTQNLEANMHLPENFLTASHGYHKREMCKQLTPSLLIIFSICKEVSNIFLSLSHKFAQNLRPIYNLHSRDGHLLDVLIAIPRH